MRMPGPDFDGKPQIHLLQISSCPMNRSIGRQRCLQEQQTGSALTMTGQEGWSPKTVSTP